MPALSVVLVVHREQAYIEECLRSVLDQAAPDVEVVAVDDASPDHGPRLLDDLAERDARLTVHHRAERAGIGPARDFALERTAGDYVWFIETTDLLAGGSLGAVLDALRTTAPDVLLVPHDRSGPLGDARPGPQHGVLRRIAADGPGSLDRHSGAAATAPRIWDKVLRRDSLIALGAPFGRGLHGELAVTWPALLTADRIAAVPQPAYVRRRPGNAVRHGTAHDVLAHYEAVFAFADRHAAQVGDRRRLILPSMLEHELQLLRGLRGEQRRDFLQGISDAVARHRRDDEPLPGEGAARLRAELAARGADRPLAVLDRAVAARRDIGRRRKTLARRRRRAAAAVERRRLDAYYRARCREPLDPTLAVFASYWYRGYSCNPRAIYEKAREVVPGFRGVWVVGRDGVDALPPGVEHVVAGTREYYDVLARATYFVNNVNFPDHLVKREGTVHVMTHHGTPLKTMGLDLRHTPVAGRRMNFAALLSRCRRWDFSVSSNPLSTLVWERVFPVRYETLEVGYPRNDALATATGDDVQRVRAELGISPGQTAVLYAPTHREYRDDYEATMDIGAVADSLGDGHVLLARLHYFYGQDPQLGDLHRAGRIIDVAAHPSIEQLCLAADVLVTDYSSLMFDYAVLDRPIVIHAPDWEVYRAMRGTYFDLMEERPGVIARSDDEVVEALLSGAAAGDAARADRAAFRARFCPWDDGHAAERVVRRVWLGERQPAPRSDLAVTP